MRVEVKVFPGASRERVTEKDGKIKVYVTVPPERGKANARVIELIADRYKIRKSGIRILRGASSREKTLEVDID